MAEPLRNIDELQKQLAEFEDMQRQLQLIIAQRQQLILQVEEIKIAQQELAKCDKGIYRALGPLLIETTKSEASEELKNRKELFELRAGMLAKEEEKLRPKLNELRSALEKSMNQSRAR